MKNLLTWFTCFTFVFIMKIQKGNIKRENQSPDFGVSPLLQLLWFNKRKLEQHEKAWNNHKIWKDIHMKNIPNPPDPGVRPETAVFCFPAPYGWKTYREKSDMHAVKLKPDELLLAVVRSDWLLLCRLLPRGLPNPDGPTVNTDTQKYLATTTQF